MHTPSRRLISIGLTATLIGGSVLGIPAAVFGTEIDDAAYVGVDSSYTERVEACTTAYHEAMDRVAELEGEMQANEDRIAEIEQQLPEQRQRAAQSLRALYKFNASGNGLLDLVLSADDFNEFLATIEYLDIIQEKNFEEIERLCELNNELSVTKASIEAEQREANDQVILAQQALADAETAREEARQATMAVSMEEELQRQAALEAARQHAGETFSTASGREVVVEAPAATTETPAEQPKQEEAKQEEAKQEETKQEEAAAPAEQQAPAEQPAATAPVTDVRENFINVWAPRIDAFNAGYPLAGYGRVFAAAAYDYGVDPRWSPAIARLESSSGLYCFANHNAWGWGDSEWGDWETAITSHMRGLAHGYGYTLTFGAAAKYCPPGDLWYSIVGDYMKQIWPTDQL